jgi:hypothetical protein
MKLKFGATMNVLSNWLVLPKSCWTESNLRLCEAQALILRFGLNVHFKLAGDSHEYAFVDKGSSIWCLEFLLGRFGGNRGRIGQIRETLSQFAKFITVPFSSEKALHNLNC